MNRSAYNVQQRPSSEETVGKVLVKAGIDGVDATKERSFQDARYTEIH
jgi:hypothetical protein